MAVMLALARISSAVFSRFGVPGLVGEIVLGVVLANLSFGDWSFLGMLDMIVDLESPSTNYEIFYVMAEIGVIFLLFSVGLETKVKDLLSVGKAAFYVASLGVLIPFVLGYALMAAQGQDMMHALFLGVAMVATSVGITARVIKDMKLSDTREARIIIGAAVIDDILGMVILAIVVGMAKSAASGVAMNIMDVVVTAVIAAAFVILVILFCLRVTPRMYAYMEKRRQNALSAGKKPYAFSMLTIAIVVCLAFAAIAEEIGLAAIIGAFLAGMIFADHAREWGLEPKVEVLTTFLLPLFFINVGLMVKLDSFTNLQVIMLAVAVIIVALISKYIGCGLGAKLADRKMESLSLRIIGVGMIPRGEVGIIVASYGLKYHVMSDEVYAVVVLMSVVTTLVAPPLLARLFRKKYHDTDEWSTNVI